MATDSDEGHPFEGVPTRNAVPPKEVGASGSSTADASDISLSLRPAVAAAMDAMKLPFGTLSAVQSVQAALAGVDGMKLPAGTLSAVQSVQAALAGVDGMKLPAGTLSAVQSVQAALAGVDGMKLPAGTLSAVQSVQAALAAVDGMKLPAGTLSAIQSLQGQPVLTDWAEALGRTLGPATSRKARRRREATEFFAAFEAEVNSLPALLRALAVIQTKNGHLGLVWRGQQRAAWPVDSSLTRRLREDGHDFGEEQMIAVERFQMGVADQWGISHNFGDLNFLAELQHEGVPTRLIDVSLDPEVAVWFAVEEAAENQNSDGRLLAWARSAVPRRNKPVAPPTVVPGSGGDAFWQFWADEDARRLNEWGTGVIVHSWQPPALNERMRAQRAAFLFDAEPIINADVLEMFNERLEGDWRAGEIAQATRILGFPSPHDKRARPNPADIVPMFSLRIAAAAKPEIRSYLKRKGLVETTIYPDRAGLISFLKRFDQFSKEV